MRLRFSPTAISDIDEIHAYLAERYPAAAEAVVHRIDNAIQGLLRHPERGRPGRVSGTRELVVPRSSYLVAYSLSEKDINVLAILHGGRDWPPSFHR